MAALGDMLHSLFVLLTTLS
jgi:hypothetical protein